MATEALSGADLTLTRGRQSTEDVAIHITPLVEVQTATVDVVPTNQPYVDLDVTWDGAHAAVSVGQLVKIVNGATLSAWAVIRKAPTSAKIFISTTPLGSPGFTTRVENAITAGDTLTVYTHRPLWGLYSRIANRTFFKSWDLAYTDQNTNPPPVANTGTWQSAKVSVGDSASFTLPRLGSNTSLAISGTISTYLWTLPAGVTLQSGFATSDQVIGVDAVAGRHMVSLKVTDSSAKTHTAYMWLFVSDGTTGKSLSERFNATVNTSVFITNDTQDRIGRVASMTVTGANLDTVLFPRAGILLREYPNFNGSTLSTGAFIDTFVGYIAEINYDYSKGRIPSAEIIVESPMIFARRIPQPEQALEEKSSPANWTQATSTLTNPTGAVYYAAKWHMPAILDMHDFDNDGLITPRRKFIEYPTKTQAEAMAHGARLFNCRVGSASDGTTVLREYPLYMDNTDRNALATIITWQARDFFLPYAYQKRLGQVNAIGRTGAFAYNGTQTKAWAAQKRWGQGVGESEMPSFTIAMSEGVDRVKEVAGHYLAELNADTPEISLALNKNQDIIDPVYLLWNRLTISSDYDPAGIGETNARMLPTRIDRVWEHDDEGGLKKRITIGLQPETFGQPGEEIVIGSHKSNTVNGWSTAMPVPYAPNAGDGFGALGVALVNDDTGNMAVTYNYFEDSPNWTDITGRFTGAVADFDWDYNSGYFSSGGDATQPLGVYVLSISGTTLYVQRIEDINTLEVTEVTTTTMADSSTTTEARIACSETTADFVVIHWITQASSVIKRSTDGGDTWAANVTVGSTFTDTANDNAPIGLAVEGAKQLCTGWDGSDYKVYYASTTGGAFAALGSGELADNPWAVIRSNEDGFAYGAKVQIAGAAALGDVVTLDSGGYPNVSERFANVSTIDFASAGGNPTLCVKGTDPTESFGIALELMVGLGAEYTVNNILFDGFVNCPSCGEFADWQLNFFTSSRSSAGSVIFSSEGDPANDAAWHSADANADMDVGSAGSFPVTNCAFIGISLRMVDPTGSGTIEFRFDNIDIQASTTRDNFFFTNFDTGGYGQAIGLGSYSDQSTGGLTVELPTTDGTSGNIKDCAKATGSFSASDTLAVRIDLGAEYTVTEVTWDAYVDVTTGSNEPSKVLFYDSASSLVDETNTQNVTNNATWATFVASDDDGGSLPSAGTQFVEIEIATPNGSGTTDIRIDEVQIEVTGTGTAGETHRIATYAGAPAWTDITPSGGDSPEKSYQLTIDNVSSSVLQLVTDDDTWYSSTDRGDNWTSEETSSAKKTLLTQGDAKMSGGTTSEVKLTLDGTTFATITGNLPAVWTSADTIKHVLAL